MTVGKFLFTVYLHFIDANVNQPGKIFQPIIVTFRQASVVGSVNVTTALSMCLCTIDIWVKRDQLEVTCFIISLFNAQHVSDVNTSILRSLRLICWVISWVVLICSDVCWCYVVVWLWWCGIRMQVETLVPQSL